MDEDTILKELHSAEFSLIENLDVSTFSTDVAKLVKRVLEGKYIDILTSPLAQSVLRVNDDISADRLDSRTFDFNLFFAGFNESATETSASSPLIEFELFSIGLAALNAFLQINYTGPYLPFNSTSILPKSIRDTSWYQAAILGALHIDGESPYHLIPQPYLFLIAKIFLNRSYPRLVTSRWWRSRVNFLHQRLLDDISSSLHDSILADLQAIEPLVNARGDVDTIGRYNIELGLVLTYYGQDVKALEIFEKSGKEIGLKWALTGALGRRTKFQTFDVSQLVVVAQGRDRGEKSSEVDSIRVQPQTLDLNDDTLLENIKFTDSVPIQSSTILSITPVLPPELSSIDINHPAPLHPLDSTILLALTICIKNTNPQDGLTMEEMAPYAARVLAHPRNWTVHTMALLIRTRLEATKARTVQRSVLQLQVLVDQLLDEVSDPLAKEIEKRGESKHSFMPKPHREEDIAPVRERLAYAWQMILPSRWELESELARRWISVGALKSALEIFERLEMWDQVALCWAGIGREDKAVEVLKEQLIKFPDSAKFWTLLGDVQKDPTCWQKAWEVSNERYTRAQRALGLYHYARKEYQQATDAFVKSLKVNPLNHSAWFTLGCAGLELEDWNQASEAFRRCVSLEQKDSQSWSNLASALLKMKPARKEDAFQALKQATSGSYDNWKIWENYLLVSVDVADWSEVVRAMRRIVEIRGEKAGEECIDVEVLEILIGEVVTSDPAGKDKGIARQVTELLSKNVVPLITSNPRLWDCVAKLNLWRGNFDEALDANVKEFRCWLQRTDLEHDDQAWTGSVEATEKVVDAYRNLGEKEGKTGVLVCPDWKYKARSAVRSLKGRGKSSWEATQGWDKLMELLEDLKERE